MVALSYLVVGVVALNFCFDIVGVLWVVVACGLFGFVKLWVLVMMVFVVFIGLFWSVWCCFKFELFNSVDYYGLLCFSMLGFVI